MSLFDEHHVTRDDETWVLPDDPEDETTTAWPDDVNQRDRS
jgi:hypothetical protein